MSSPCSPHFGIIIFFSGVSATITTFLLFIDPLTPLKLARILALGFFKNRTCLNWLLLTSIGYPSLPFFKTSVQHTYPLMRKVKKQQTPLAARIPEISS